MTALAKTSSRKRFRLRVTLLGPVFFHELVALARRGRYFLLRGAYAAAVFLVLLRVYWEQASTFEHGVINQKCFVAESSPSATVRSPCSM